MLQRDYRFWPEVSIFESELNIPLRMQFLIPSNAWEENKHSNILVFFSFSSLKFLPSAHFRSGFWPPLQTSSKPQGSEEFCPISDFAINVLPDLHSTSEDANHFYFQFNGHQSKKSSSHLKKVHCLNGRKLVLINNGVWSIYNLQQGAWGKKILLLSKCFSKMINDIKIPVAATWLVLDCNQEKQKGSIYSPVKKMHLLRELLQL